MKRLKSKGWGPFRYEWYSFCSAHYFHNEKCHMCQAGCWMNCWKTKISQVIFKKNPELWQWWVNGRKGVRPAIFKRK